MSFQAAADAPPLELVELRLLSERGWPGFVKDSSAPLVTTRPGIEDTQEERNNPASL